MALEKAHCYCLPRVEILLLLKFELIAWKGVTLRLASFIGLVFEALLVGL